ncbi:MAG: DEAD/DEAH box helicase, partial [Legionellales bacterium]
GNAFPELTVWEQDESARELSSPWIDSSWNAARVKVFLAALELHKAFIIANADIMRKNLHAAMDVLSGAVPSHAALPAVQSAWTSLFFVIPVISTTFASVDRLFAHLGKESLGWLLIDEGGQAVPQAAAGAIWRAKRVVVVGDPLQLEPVVSIPFTAQQMLCHHHKVAEIWLPGKTSVQQLADRISPWGTFIQGVEGPLWVGAPLRVHRRCDHLMYTISNQVAYDGMMVSGTGLRAELSWPESAWIDVQSNEAHGHWIPAEGYAVADLLQELARHGINHQDIFIISPFRAVVKNLWGMFFQRFPGIRIGTIHTVQGKEANVVILVLGSDPKKSGARQWAAAKPNLLNVAASRAKRRLYIIGNLELWQKQQYFSFAAEILPLR